MSTVIANEVDLTTHYLGLELKHPIMPGASPMVDDIGTVRWLEDCGAPAIVMRSLFEEQLTHEQVAHHAVVEGSSFSSPEATSYLPSDTFALDADQYLEQVRLIKEAVDVPVIASLNGTSLGGWLSEDLARGLRPLDGRARVRHVLRAARLYELRALPGSVGV